jgi:hypothetical protein
MIENGRTERRIIKAMFGDAARLVERGPHGSLPGSVEIDLDGRRLGNGPTFRQALALAQRRLRADERQVRR